MCGPTLESAFGVPSGCFPLYLGRLPGLPLGSARDFWLGVFLLHPASGHSREDQGPRLGRHANSGRLSFCLIRRAVGAFFEERRVSHWRNLRRRDRIRAFAWVGTRFLVGCLLLFDPASGRSLFEERCLSQWRILWLRERIRTFAWVGTPFLVGCLLCESGERLVFLFE